ncbi:acyl-CoA N-acyltransferase [Whalleya microplaca]|nr:acyl-CoA N-acyltransferase [Whalleya microplaca]
MACEVATRLPYNGHSSHNITIRDALLSDAGAIAQIGADTFTATFGFSVPPDDLANYLAATYSAHAIEVELRDKKTTTFVAHDDLGIILGFVQLVRSSTEVCIPGEPASHAELRRLYVDITAQGRGIGSKLIAAVENNARAEGFKMLWLTVWEDNRDAKRLYETLHFGRVGEVDFATGNCIQTDWVMAKTLR